MNQALRQKHVSVLDDDPEVSALISHLISSEGMQAKSFEMPLPFLESIRTDPPDLIVLDISLGKSDAIEVIRKLSKIPYSGRLLIISGHSEDILREVYDIGMAHGLAMVTPLRKPFLNSQFRERLTATAKARVMPTKNSKDLSNVDLSEAIAKRYLELWYQPKIDLNSLKICGGEALIRLRHPKHGVLTPADFLPASNHPLFESISIFVLSTAMKHLKFLLDHKLQTTISVNMPASTVTEPGFVSNVRMVLPKTDYRSLIVEVTEDEVIKDASLIREVSTQLRILNVGISIDDFGVAHSSLARLQELPCVEIKLDRQFVSNCSVDPLKRGICQTVADLARRFDISACAEGVETAEDLKTIMQMGFNTAQGYLFAKPMPFESFVKTILRNTTDYSMKNTYPSKPAETLDTPAVTKDTIARAVR